MTSTTTEAGRRVLRVEHGDVIRGSASEAVGRSTRSGACAMRCSSAASVNPA